MSDLVSLPEFALMCVLSQLHYRDLLNVGFTCRVLHELALSDYLWMRFCSPWKALLNLKSWRAGVDSACALFRALSSLGKLVGYWTAPELTPRGGLLFVTWGHVSVVAYRIVIPQTGDLKMQHLFDVVALPNGCTMTKIFTRCTTLVGPRGLSLLGGLVWPSQDENEFYLELTEPCEVSLLHMKQSDPLGNMETSFVVTDNDIGMIGSDVLQLSHIMKFLNTSFGLGQYAYEDEDCVYIDGDCKVLGVTSQKRIAGSLYTRLIVEEACKEFVFSGLWAGLYGPHGVEIMNVSYTREEIFATKVLGDPNVPCGQITFKAKIATESSDISPSLQALMNLEVKSADAPFTITKLYHGCGQIADTGFERPQWVRGKLLVDQRNIIAFLWEDDNFVILFEKLHLPSLYEGKEESLLTSIM